MAFTRLVGLVCRNGKGEDPLHHGFRGHVGDPVGIGLRRHVPVGVDTDVDAAALGGDGDGIGRDNERALFHLDDGNSRRTFPAGQRNGGRAGLVARIGLDGNADLEGARLARSGTHAHPAFVAGGSPRLRSRDLNLQRLSLVAERKGVHVGPYLTFIFNDHGRVFFVRRVGLFIFVASERQQERCCRKGEYGQVFFHNVTPDLKMAISRKSFFSLLTLSPEATART